MDELYRIDILGLTPIDLDELQAELPEGSVQEKVTPRKPDEFGFLDPVTATIIVTLGLAAIKGLAAWSIKNRVGQTIELEVVEANGQKQRIRYAVDASTSEADVIDGLTKLMPRVPNLPKGAEG